MTCKTLEGSPFAHIPQIEGESIDCCVTMIPIWGVEAVTMQKYIEGLKLVFRMCKRVLKKNGQLWVNVGQSWGVRIQFIRALEKDKWHLRAHIAASEKSLDQFGSIIMFTKNIKRSKDISSIPDCMSLASISAMYQYCIKAGCPKGGTVLDPFAGGGITGQIANSLGRHSILIVQ